MTIRDRVSEELTASNLLCRRPEWYDQVQADPDHTVALQVEQAVTEHVPAARTLLDIGCGTGRDVEHLAERFDCVGVDVQPNLVAYARRVRPGLDIRVGDMRSFRLGRQVDVITCLGNSLAYLDDADLPAAFATFDAHARPGTLLVVSTLTRPILVQPRTHRIDTVGLHGQVTISYEWREPVNTMIRAWRLDDGTAHEDRIPPGECCPATGWRSWPRSQASGRSGRQTRGICCFRVAVLGNRTRVLSL